MGIKIISENRKARHNYEILDTLEVGLVLIGSEVKSLRTNQVSIKEAYIILKRGELFIQKMHIPKYKQDSNEDYNPERLRKILCHKKEVNEIIEALEIKGQSCVPTKVYFKEGKAKLEVALAKGKKKFDKRQEIKKKSAQKKLKSRMRKYKK